VSLPPVVRETVKLGDLNPAAYNPRRISKAALKGLAASLERFGLVQEIVVNRRNMTVIGGHQRLKVLEAKGIKDVPVAFVELSDSEERALNIALNNQSIGGEFDTDALAELLKGIKAEEAELFTALRLDRLAGDVPIEEVQYVPKYEVVVTCTGEAQQEELYNRLTGEGLKVRVLTL
jgi:ParB-like nuclease domain